MAQDQEDSESSSSIYTRSFNRLHEAIETCARQDFSVLNDTDSSKNEAYQSCQTDAANLEKANGHCCASDGTICGT